ncbi:MAG: hypothetical protein WC760_01025 [Bacteroidia bacterium]|jgi:hypothetical protein
MIIYAFIFLQPDPDLWPDPDNVPINQHVMGLWILAIAFGIFSIWYQSYRQTHKN